MGTPSGVSIFTTTSPVKTGKENEMTRFTRFITVAALMLLSAAPLAGQGLSRSADATATVTIARTLNLANITGLDFGEHFANEGSIFVPAPARWDGDTDPNSDISISFSALPASLVRPEGGSVPISYGTESGQINTSTSSTPFNPATGISSFSVNSDGLFNIQLGYGTVESNGVQVDLTGAAPGTYSATITLTVTVI